MQFFCAAALLLNVCASEMGRRPAFDVFQWEINYEVKTLLVHISVWNRWSYSQDSGCDLICSVIIAVPMRSSVEYLSMFPRLHQH